MAITGDSFNRLRASSSLLDINSDNEKISEEETVREVNEEIENLEKALAEKEKEAENKNNSDFLVISQEFSKKPPQAKDSGEIRRVRTESNPSPFQRFFDSIADLFKPIKGTASDVDIRIKLQQANSEKAESFWKEEILPNWKNMHKKDKLASIVLKGVPTGVRGLAWIHFIGNKLGITTEIFEESKQKALEKRKLQKNEEEQQNAQRLIEQDLPRTFPRLALFQKRFLIFLIFF